MMRRLLALLLFALAALAIAPAAAHKPSDSYLSLRPEAAHVVGQWDIALRDLDFAIGLDRNNDGDITWGELKARQDAIAAYALARLKLAADGRPCPLQAGEHLVDRHSDGAYAVLRFSGQCAADAQSLEVSYALFFDIDPQHKGLLRLDLGGNTVTAVFSPETARRDFALGGVSRVTQFTDYLREGVWHIWIGYDHILFLVSLLLPAVLLRRDGKWQPVAGFAPAFWDVLRIVTSFTIAHSITLSLAALGVLQLPSRLVESAIAASVVLAAANNLWPVVGGNRWMVAFLFGLIHGFGFASVLADLGLPRDALVLALVGFNVGVEAGQLAIVATFLPLAHLLRATGFYRRLVLVGGSMAIAAIAAVWLAERAFDVRFISS